MRRDEDRLVWWPPEPVLELARLAVDSGGDVGAIHRAIDPTPITVSDFWNLQNRSRIACNNINVWLRTVVDVIV